jgi:hypothetical protein
LIIIGFKKDLLTKNCRFRINQFFLAVRTLKRNSEQIIKNILIRKSTSKKSIAGTEESSSVEELELGSKLLWSRSNKNMI